MKYFVLICLFSWSVMAEIIDNRQYSVRYFAGEYLIYDCLDRHWVCADEEANKKCHKKRKEETLRDLPRLSCIPVKKFKDVHSCTRRKKKMVDNPVDDLLCQHPRLLKKPFISF